MGANTPWIRRAGGRSPKQLLVAGSFALTAEAATAQLDLATCNAQLDCVVSAVSPGPDGNDITIEIAGDSGAAEGVTIDRDGTDFVIHFESGVSDQGDLVDAINALTGEDKLIIVADGDEGTEGTTLENGRSVLDAGDLWVNMDCDMRATMAGGIGTAGDGITLAITALTARAGELAVDRTNRILTFFIEDGVTDVENLTDAIDALTGEDALLEVTDYGTPATALAYQGDDKAKSTVSGNDTNAEQAATALTGGAVPGAVTLVGGAEVESVEHVSTGLYRLTMRDRFPVRLSSQAEIYAPAAAAYEVHVGPYIEASRTIDIRIQDIGTSDLVDPDPADEIEVHFQMWVALMEG